MLVLVFLVLYLPFSQNSFQNIINKKYDLKILNSHFEKPNFYLIHFIINPKIKKYIFE
jgi:hypothetical protein